MKRTLALTALGLIVPASAAGPNATHAPPYGPPHAPGGVHRFSLIAEGPQTAHGPIGQIYDGQCRIGVSPPASFFLRGGRVIDSRRRGCILAGSPSQWQCDANTARKKPPRLSPLYAVC
jgi:hypothetical protein